MNLALGEATNVEEFSRIDSFVGSGSSQDELTGPDAGDSIDVSSFPIARLEFGLKVQVLVGDLAGNVYQYIGTTSSDSDPNTAGDQPFEFSDLDFTDESLWQVSDTTANWIITGANSGEVDGYLFSAFANLTGRGASSDYFLFEVGGSLSGTVDGGTGVGTSDGVAVSDGTTTTVLVTDTLTSPAAVSGRTINFAGMDSVTVLTGDDVDRVISGSVFNDEIELLKDTAGRMKVKFVGTNYYDGIGYNTEFSFANPSSSLTIRGKAGGDTITVKSMDPGFAADLLLYGNTASTLMIAPDPGKDEIYFETDVYTGGGYLEVFADKINISDNKILSTLTDQNDLSSGNDIVFRARRVGTTELENLLPSGYLSKSVEINVGAGANLLASSIYLIASAEDRALADTLGLTTLESQFFVDPAVNFLQDLIALPIKVMIKASDAKVIIGDGAQLLADNVVGVYSTAASDASASAASSLFSLGYSQSDATATITIGDNVLIEGNGPVNITASASSVASISTETAREEQGSIPGKKSSGFAASLAVSWAKLTSTVTVAETAEVHGGRTVNIRALGDIESEAEASSSLYADGSAALALALQFSTAAILTQVDGKVTADMNTNGGEVVKFEFDPTVAASDYTSSETATRVAPGETVKLVSDMTLNLGSGPQTIKSGTVLMYMGETRRNNVNLSSKSSAGYEETFVNSDGDTVQLWTISSEPWGYVDTANDRISVFNLDNDAGNWVVVTEDTVQYSPRRGTSIGGLDPGEYVIVSLPDNPATAVDESRYVKLARGEQKAIDAYLWEAAFNTGTNPHVVNLTSGATTNNRSFGAADIDKDTITLNGVGNTFELGQAVIYREPGRTDSDKVVDGKWQSKNAIIDGTDYVPLIEGLEHGGLYYVMAGVDQFNLIGDQRLVDGQSLQLGALENETRGGIARVKLGAVSYGAAGFTLSATQILDSTFLTFGIGTALNATDTASAEAGFESEDLDDKKKDDDGGYDWKSSAFDNLFGKASEKFGQKNKAGGAANLQVAGALAFSYTDHDAKTLITSTADLNSNDDMELTSGITQNLKITAESTGEAQKGKKDKVTKKAAPGKAADTAVSAAIVVGVQNNASQAIVEGGAELDSMRALRLLSGVTYPFLSRPDEFVPTSTGEFSDKITSEGFDFFNTYLDGTGGLQSLFNTWARSTTKADKLAIAGSLNVMVMNNIAESIVHSGAQINQDPFDRPSDDYYTNPDHDPTIDNDNITHSANANNVDEHVVSIEAINYMQFLNMTGVFGFHLPSLELSDPLTFAKNGIDSIDMSFELSPGGASSKRGGVGGAVFLQFLDNTTHAIIEPGVNLYSGRSPGLTSRPKRPLWALLSPRRVRMPDSWRLVDHSRTLNRTATHSHTLRRVPSSKVVESMSTRAALKPRSTGRVAWPRARPLVPVWQSPSTTLTGPHAR